MVKKIFIIIGALVPLVLFVLPLFVGNVAIGQRDGKIIEIEIADTANRILEKRVDILEFQKMPLARMFGKLAFYIPISFEEIEFGDDKVQPVKRNNITVNLITDRPEYRREFRNKSYRDILNELVSLENYFWDISPNGVINVLPRGKKDNKYSQSILNHIIPRLDIENVEIQVLFSGAHPFGRMLLEKYHIGYISLVIGKNTVGPTKVSVHLKNATIRECLNAIVKAAGDNFYWRLNGWRRAGEHKGKKIKFRFLCIGISKSLD